MDLLFAYTVALGVPFSILAVHEFGVATFITLIAALFLVFGLVALALFLRRGWAGLLSAILVGSILPGLLIYSFVFIDFLVGKSQNPITDPELGRIAVFFAPFGAIYALLFWGALFLQSQNAFAARDQKGSNQKA